MSRKIIELVEVLVDRIYDCGYQQRAREDDIADVYKRLNEAEGQAKHWKQARQDAMAAGELMRAEIEMLRQQLDAAQAAVTLQRSGIERLQAFVNLSRRLLGANIAYVDVGRLRSALAELDAGTEPAPVAETLDAEVDSCSGGKDPDARVIAAAPDMLRLLRVLVETHDSGEGGKQTWLVLNDALNETRKLIARLDGEA